jgi:hypothetical protein
MFHLRESARSLIRVPKMLSLRSTDCCIANQRLLYILDRTTDKERPIQYSRCVTSLYDGGDNVTLSQ